MRGLASMIGTYEQRKVVCYEKGKLIVDTCRVTDSDKDYETGISHPRYNNRNWIIVELYDTKEQAATGHDKWVKVMTSEKLPEKLEDVSTSVFALISKLP